MITDTPQKKNETLSRSKKREAFFFQPKLTINQLNDVYEQEADAMAEKVMRMPINGGSFFPAKPVSISRLQRKCAACEEEEKLQKKESSSFPVEASSDVSSYISSLSSKGSPLPDNSRNFFESRFGHDFSNVKIHDDAEAARSAQSINAAAYAAGNNIVFNNGQFSVDTDGGKRLLAHELTHTLQQSSNAPTANLQRDSTPITGTEKSIKSYDVTTDGGSPHQVKTGSRTVGFADLQMSYDESSSIFHVTFPLTWIFLHSWTDDQRKVFVKEFEASVKRVWEDRFVLKETGVKHPRSAHVKIDFSENIIGQMKSDWDEAMALDKILKSQSTWLMDVRDLKVRSNVSGSTVHLGEGANKPNTQTGAQIRANTGFSVHDGNDKKKFTQTASPHEFGHMIGLGDEYLNDSGTAVQNIDPARGYINSRIMNVGETVTPDVYAPFADWLSDLTSGSWKVGHKI